jgi:hypothetical protein
MSKNSKNSKRPRLQTTVASDITPKHQITHSSNTATRTRQIMTTNELDPTNITAPIIDFSLYDFPATVELDVPAGVEIRTKAPRYINSASVIF